MKASFPCEFEIFVFFFFSTRPWFCISTKNYWPALLVAFMPKTVSFSFPSKPKTAFKNEIKMCLCFGFAKILRNTRSCFGSVNIISLTFSKISHFFFFFFASLNNSR